VVVPAVRWSHIGIADQVARAAGDFREADADTAKTSPGLGVVFKAREWLSLYASGQQGFEPPAPGQYLGSGRALSPSENGSIEGGLKIDRPGGRLRASVAAYRIRRTNVAEAEATGFYRQIGEGASHGLELDASAVPVAGLVVRGGYAWTRAEVTEDISGFVGNDLPNAPRHKINLWARYRQPEGLLNRLTVAGGVVYVSERFIAANNLVVAPAYTRIDATASYALSGRTLALGVTAGNLTNRHYVTSGAGRTLFAATGRRIAIQLTSAF
jgi:iron complex outermembrane receptor protein